MCAHDWLAANLSSDPSTVQRIKCYGCSEQGNALLSAQRSMADRCTNTRLTFYAIFRLIAGIDYLLCVIQSILNRSVACA